MGTGSFWYTKCRLLDSRGYRRERRRGLFVISEPTNLRDCERRRLEGMIGRQSPFWPPTVGGRDVGPVVSDQPRQVRKATSESWE